jgi:uncharacterized BrkB/YihY/UPF0761 family membrane protein
MAKVTRRAPVASTLDGIIHSVPRSRIKLVCLLAAVLLPVAADGSFGGTPCRADFGCHFIFWGILLAFTWGIPISVLTFALLHLGFRHPARSKGKQAILGGVIGIVAFEISAACAALMASWGKNPWIGLVSAYAVLAIFSVVYARSSPRHHLRREGGDAD